MGKDGEGKLLGINQEATQLTNSESRNLADGEEVVTLGNMKKNRSKLATGWVK